MQSDEQILFKREFIRPDDYRDFNLEIESLIKIHKLTSGKKIVICSTELIQNNIIHNNSSPSIIEISTNYNSTIIEYSQTVNEEQFLKINSLINTINNKDLITIKDLIKTNIMNDSKNSSCGNGLMICRLKSENIINVQLINKVSSGNETYYYFKIQLKINNNDKDN
jgi:hypothetical protein